MLIRLPDPGGSPFLCDPNGKDPNAHLLELVLSYDYSYF